MRCAAGRVPHIQARVTRPALPSVDAAPTREILAAKVADGASIEWLHDRTGAAPAVLRGVLDGSVPAVPAVVADRVAGLADVTPPRSRAPRPSRGVPAGPVREHLTGKVEQGATLQWIVAQSGVSEDTVQSVLSGARPTVYAKTAARLLAVDATPPPPNKPVDPAPTLARVRDLVEAHWPLTEIARRAGLSERTVQESELAGGVSAVTEARILRVWTRLAGRAGPTVRPYPWLGELAATFAAEQVAAGASVAVETVQHLITGGAVGRQTARAVCSWVVLERQRRNLAGSRAA